MTQIVSNAEVRAYLKLENDQANSQYTDATISSNVLAAQNVIEQATGRWFLDRPTTSYTTTTLYRPVVAIPGFRSFTAITWGGAAQTFSGSSPAVTPIPDALQTGLYLSLQFRAFLGGRAGPAYLGDPLYWDKGLDFGLAALRYYGQTSAPLDLVVEGAGGYATGTEPFALRHAVKILAGFYTMRPASILADVAITAQGGVLNYAQMPAEVRDFIASFRAGPQMVAI